MYTPIRIFLKLYPDRTYLLWEEHLLIFMILFQALLWNQWSFWFNIKEREVNSFTDFASSNVNQRSGTIFARLRELSLYISRFIITKERNILPTAGKRLLTVSRMVQSEKCGLTRSPVFWGRIILQSLWRRLI